MFDLPIEEIVRTAAARPPGRVIGRSRAGRGLLGFEVGRGPVRVSLIGGCHADEPVGPAMLRLLVSHLVTQPQGSPLLQRFTWRIVPDCNPDGASLNKVWSTRTAVVSDHCQLPDRAYDPVLFVSNVVREMPGDDVEFGFPRSQEDFEARPENRAIAEFLAPAAPLHLHASFHGMSFAPGPWFLIEPAWVPRSDDLRQRLLRTVRSMGYVPFDVDRHGEKGFHRIGEGFSTRPDSRAMAEHFQQRGDHQTAAKFRPSSMEFVRSLGGDPMTIVSEMPLFLYSRPDGETQTPPPFRIGTEGRRELHDWLLQLAATSHAQQVRQELARAGIRPMPIRDQMRLQLAFLDASLRMVVP